MSIKRVNRIAGQFDAREITMLESPAYRVASLSCRMIMDRLAIEYANHGGKDNGKLPVTYKQFEEYGLHRDAISLAIHEGEALGLFFVTEHGRAAPGEDRSSNLYRIPYRAVGNCPPTHEWKAIKTDDDAKRIARIARAAAPKKQKAAPGNRTRTDHGNHDRKPRFPPPETMGTGATPETMGTSIYRGGGERSRERPMTSAERGRLFRERKKRAAALNGHTRPA
jgi:hypothetical protein